MLLAQAEYYTLMNKLTVSAPGKLMLFGEHAVAYDKPCLVTAVYQRMQATVALLNDAEFQLDAPDVKVTGYKKSMRDLGHGDIPKGAKFVEIAIKNFKEKYRFSNGIKITTTLEFSSKFGFGSSSASTVCVIKALAEITKQKLSQQELFQLAYKTVLAVQGKGSGFDVAAAVYGGTLYFVTGGKVIEPLKIKTFPLIVGYSGIKADTVTLINQVKEKAEKYPEIIKNIYASIELLIEPAKIAIEKKDWHTVGELMDMNQGYLSALGVSTGKLEHMLSAARSAKAYGAKLSGAGGGDCIIALAPEKKKQAVEKAIEQAGGEIMDVITNAEGVRIEK